MSYRCLRGGGTSNLFLSSCRCVVDGADLVYYENDQMATFTASGLLGVGKRGTERVKRSPSPVRHVSTGLGRTI